MAVLALSLTFAAIRRRPATSPGRRRGAGSARSPNASTVSAASSRTRTPSRCTAIFGVPRALEQSAATRRAGGAGDLARRRRRTAERRRRSAPRCTSARYASTARRPIRRRELFPIGDVFSLAERLLGHVGAGEVLVSPAAARRIERDFVLAQRLVQLGPEAGDRVDAHAVVQPRHGVAADPEATPTVRRPRARARSARRRLRAAPRRGTATSCSSPARPASASRGCSPSCACASPASRIGGSRGAARRTATTTPFLPLIDALRRDAGIDDRDDERSASAKIDAAVGARRRSRLDAAVHQAIAVAARRRRGGARARRRQPPQRAVPRPARLPAARRRARAVGDRRRGSPLGRSRVGGVARVPRRRDPGDARAARGLASHRLPAAVPRPQLSTSTSACRRSRATTWR